MYIDLDHSFTTISNILHRLPNSSKLIKDNYSFFFNNKAYKGKVYIDSFTENTSNFTIRNCKFNYASFEAFISHICFGFKLIDESYSLVYNAFKQNLIQSLSFGFKLNAKKEETSYMFLGGIPNEMNNKKYYGFCNVKRNYDSWGCILKEVIVEGIKYVSNEYLYFSFKSERFLYTRKFDFFMRENIMNLVKNGLSDYIDPIPIKMLIENYYVVMNNAILLNLLGTFSIIGDRNEAESWVMGKEFFKNFIVLFNYSEKTVNFYSNNIIEYYSTNKSQKVLFVINSIINIIFILIYTIKLILR